MREKVLILSSALHALVEHCNYGELYKAIRQNHNWTIRLQCFNEITNRPPS